MDTIHQEQDEMAAFKLARMQRVVGLGSLSENNDHDLELPDHEKIHKIDTKFSFSSSKLGLSKNDGESSLFSSNLKAMKRPAVGSVAVIAKKSTT